MPDVVLVHRISGLPRASFRFHLAMDTLASGYVLGATPCARDFHPLERAHAGRTNIQANELMFIRLLYRSSGNSRDYIHPSDDKNLLLFL